MFDIEESLETFYFSCKYKAKICVTSVIMLSLNFILNTCIFLLDKMSEKCSISSCVRISYALCHGCKLNFCREHMFEHSLATHSQLNPLKDEVTQMNNELKELNLKDLFRSSYQQLEEWRRRSHQIVDIYFAEKAHDLDSYINEKLKQLKNELDEILIKINSYLREKETTHEQINLLTFQIKILQRDLDKTKKNDIQIQINPLNIDKNLISFNQFIRLSAFPPVYRIIDRNDESFTPVATDNEFLLLHHEGTLLLVNQDLTNYKQIPWTHGPIYDMCYSSTLSNYLLTFYFY